MNIHKIEFSENILLLEDALATYDKAAIAEQMKILERKGRPVRAAEIADMYEQGSEKINPSVELAYSWYWSSAYQENDKDGFFGLARFYFSGIYVNRDPVTALEYFKNASDLESDEADLMLGYMYLQGVDTPRNIEQAETHLTSAASKGFVAAYYMLARVEKSRKNYLAALKFWCRCIIQARRLTMVNPQDRRLYLLHGAWT